jgi:hypothetical protein
MADHQISMSLAEYPNGKIRSIVADGTHWVTVSTSNMSANISAMKAREEVLLALKEEVEGMPDALTGAPGKATVLDIEDVLDAINNRLKEF